VVADVGMWRWFFWGWGLRSFVRGLWLWVLVDVVATHKGMGGVFVFVCFVYRKLSGFVDRGRRFEVDFFSFFGVDPSDLKTDLSPTKRLTRLRLPKSLGISFESSTSNGYHTGANQVFKDP